MKFAILISSSVNARSLEVHVIFLMTLHNMQGKTVIRGNVVTFCAALVPTTEDFQNNTDIKAVVFTRHFQFVMPPHRQQPLSGNVFRFGTNVNEDEQIGLVKGQGHWDLLNKM